MQIVVTAVGPDHKGLADPIIHFLTTQGANIAEIQMYDHDEEHVFAMLCRAELEVDDFGALRKELTAIGVDKELSVRVWCHAGHCRQRGGGACVARFGGGGGGVRAGGQHGHDACRRHRRKARLVGHANELRALGTAQGVAG